MTLVASTLASTGESLMIGGSEASQVENCHQDAGGCYYPALPSILSYLPKSSAYKACLSVHFDEITRRTAIRHNRNPSRTVTDSIRLQWYTSQYGWWSQTIGDTELHQSDKNKAIYNALKLREQVDGESPKHDAFLVSQGRLGHVKTCSVYYAGKNKPHIMRRTKVLTKVVRRGLESRTSIT